MRIRFRAGMAAAAIGIVALALASIAYGSTPIPLGQVIDELLSAAGLGGQTTEGPVGRIVVDLRLPRVLMTICVGAGLGVVGMLLQTVTRNDLADPFLFGLSAGAATGAVAVITITGDLLGIWTLPAAAFAGGLVATGVVLILLSRAGNRGSERLILAGLAVSFLFTALTNYLVFSGDQRAAHSVLFWTMGGLGLARWGTLPLVLAGLPSCPMRCCAIDALTRCWRANSPPKASGSACRGCAWRHSSAPASPRPSSSRSPV